MANPEELRPGASFKTTVYATYATSHTKAVILKNKLDLKKTHLTVKCEHF